MRAFLGATLIAALCLASPAARAESKDSGDLAEAKKGIAAANAKFSAAVEHHDAVAVAALYTKDATVLPPDHPMVHGSSAIEAFWKDTVAAGLKGASLKTIDVERSGDVAVETGIATMTLEPEGKEAQAVTAKYVVVWKREKDGAWRLHRDIWNAMPQEKK
jgi:uncharacterized protein (TIGR02246 family)